MSNSSLMPVPDAEISAWISSLRNILSIRERSTFRILPRIGRIAWKRGSRAFLALPPALSPSTMNSSASSALRVEQSASLPGISADSSSDLRRVRSRAWRAAIRACAACVDLVTMALASFGCSSSHSASFSLVARSTNDRISVLPSFVLV